MESYTPERRQLDVTLIRGMGVIALLSALTGLARVGQDAAIAWRFGTGPMVDAYYFLLSLATWPVAVALSALTALFAPAEAILRRGGEASAQRFRAELLGWVLLAASVSLPLAWYALQAIAGSAIGGLEQAAAAQASAGVRGLVAVVPLGIVAALLSAWFVARSRHVLALLEAFPPLVLMVAIMAVPGPVVFWGTSAGVAIQVLAMALLLRQARELPAPRLGFSSTAWHGFSRGAVAMLSGQVLFALAPLVDAFIATRLGEGTMGTLSYANRLVLGLLGVAGLAMQRAALPLLSHVSAQSPSMTLDAARRWTRIAIATGALMALIVSLLADPLVSVLFERGSFTASDRAQVATLLRYGSLQLPVFLGGMVMVTALASLRAHGVLALAACAGLCVKLVLSPILVAVTGVAGLPLATALMYGATTVIMWMVLRRRLQPSAF